MKFFKCDICGNIIEMVKESGMPVSCCGQNMTELVPSSTDGALEKHVPVYNVQGTKVTINVGSTAHPMLDAHYIEWIVLETSEGVYRKNLKPGDEPMATFIIGDGERIVGVYEYCNIHGLWKA